MSKVIRESDIVAKFGWLIQLLGGITYKFTSPGNAGVPDAIVILNGITFFVEFKAPGKYPRTLQRKVIGDMTSHGARVAVVGSLAIKDQLEAIKMCTGFDYAPTYVELLMN